jgi:hypothetical protein
MTKCLGILLRYFPSPNDMAQIALKSYKDARDAHEKN